MSKTELREQGMVSIIVTMVMIIVISLIVLGFSEVTRRNQREALNNQLSTQAYYAAESGVNRAAAYISNNPSQTITTTNCKDFITGTATNPYLNGTYGANGSAGTNVLDAATRTEFTCLTVNTTPGSLEVKPLSQTSSQVWHIQDAAGNPFTSFNLTWLKDPVVAVDGACGSVTGNSQYGPAWNCAYGILRIDLVSIPASGTVTNALLEDPKNTTTLFLEPSYAATASVSASLALPVAATTPCAGPNCPAQIVHVKCSQPSVADKCNLVLNLTSSTAEYFARLSMVYQDSSDVTLKATDSTGNALFKNGQAVVDSTGQSQDELRRIQVRIPLVTPASSLPSYALQSTSSICKLISAGPSAQSIPYIDNCP